MIRWQWGWFYRRQKITDDTEMKCKKSFTIQASSRWRPQGVVLKPTPLPAKALTPLRLGDRRIFWIIFMLWITNSKKADGYHQRKGCCMVLHCQILFIHIYIYIFMRKCEATLRQYPSPHSHGCIFVLSCGSLFINKNITVPVYFYRPFLLKEPSNYCRNHFMMFHACWENDDSFIHLDQLAMRFHKANRLSGNLQ